MAPQFLAHPERCRDGGERGGRVLDGGVPREWRRVGGSRLGQLRCAAAGEESCGAATRVQAQDVHGESRTSRLWVGNLPNANAH